MADSRTTSFFFKSKRPRFLNILRKCFCSLCAQTVKRHACSYIKRAILLVFSSSPPTHHLTLWPLQKIKLMRLGINMLNHPPQPSIIGRTRVRVCVCVCRAGGQGCVKDGAASSRHLHYTNTQTHARAHKKTLNSVYERQRHSRHAACTRRYQ